MEDNNKDLLKFFIQKEKAPDGLVAVVKNDIHFMFHKKMILSKFIVFQICGAALSLFFCPQFGLGAGESHGIVHHLKMMGDWACAAYCGSLFFTSGLVMSSLGMKGKELSWIWRIYKYNLFFLPPLLWSALMLVSSILKNNSESLEFHAVWILSALLTQTVLLLLRNKLHVYQLRQFKA